MANSTQTCLQKVEIWPNFSSSEIKALCGRALCRGAAVCDRPIYIRDAQIFNAGCMRRLPAAPEQ